MHARVPVFSSEPDDHNSRNQQQQQPQFSPSETVIVSSFGAGKLNRGGFATVDLTEKPAPPLYGPTSLIKTEGDLNNLAKQLDIKTTDLNATLTETATNLDLYEQLRKQPIWTVLSAMATAGLCSSVNELLEQPRTLLANFPNGQYYANDTIVRKTINQSKVEEERNQPSPHPLKKTVTNNQMHYIRQDVDVPATSVQAILHPLKTKKLPLKDTTNTYLDMALIRMRDFCPNLSTVRKRQWIIDSGRTTTIIT